MSFIIFYSVLSCLLIYLPFFSLIFIFYKLHSKLSSWPLKGTDVLLSFTCSVTQFSLPQYPCIPFLPCQMSHWSLHEPGHQVFWYLWAFACVSVSFEIVPLSLPVRIHSEALSYNLSLPLPRQNDFIFLWFLQHLVLLLSQYSSSSEFGGLGVFL